MADGLFVFIRKQYEEKDITKLNKYRKNKKWIESGKKPILETILIKTEEGWTKKRG